MNNSMISASVAMQGLQQKLDIIGNNLSNANTVGYKRREASFEDVLTNVKQQPKGFTKEGRMTPLGFTQTWGSRMAYTQLNMSQGSLTDTGLDTDLAIEGNALFEVQTISRDENGNPVTRSAWTRNGSFQLSTMTGDPNNLYLTDADGHFVSGADDQPIRIPRGRDIAIDDRGNITAYSATDSSVQPIQVGRLKIMQVLKPQLLNNLGDNLYELSATVANPQQVLRAIDLNRLPAENPTAEDRIAVRQRMLEQSNVNMVDEMTELLTFQRSYQMNSRAISSSDTMMGLANNLRG